MSACAFDLSVFSDLPVAAVFSDLSALRAHNSFSESAPAADCTRYVPLGAS
jgi:hypothetical protein